MGRASARKPLHVRFSGLYETNHGTRMARRLLRAEQGPRHPRPRPQARKVQRLVARIPATLALWRAYVQSWVKFS